MCARLCKKGWHAHTHILFAVYPPQSPFRQGVELVEQGGDDYGVDGHQEDLQGENEAPQIEHHVRAGVLENEGEASYHRGRDGESKQQLHTTERL